MNTSNVNNTNFSDVLNNVIIQIQALSETQSKKAALPEILRGQQETIFNSVQGLLSFAISANNDTPLKQVAAVLGNNKDVVKILNIFNYAVRRQAKTGELKRTEYAKRDAKSAANAVESQENPFTVAYIEEQKEAKRVAKDNAKPHEKLEGLAKKLTSISKEADKLGLNTYSEQIKALLVQISLEIEKAQHQENEDVANMPSIASQSRKAA